jgi:UMF1 family MFS transporter
LRQAATEGIADLLRLVRGLPRQKLIGRFLLARLFYTDGLNVLFAFGAIYAAGVFGMGFEEILLFGIALNVTGGIGAALGGWVEERLGARTTILAALVALVAAAVALVLALVAAVLAVVAEPDAAVADEAALVAEVEAPDAEVEAADALEAAFVADVLAADAEPAAAVALAAAAVADAPAAALFTIRSHLATSALELIGVVPLEVCEVLA